jgi:thiamine-monophosphate kinase
MTEDEIVASLRSVLSSKIGDDAAVIGDQVITTDMLVEGVDFTADLPLRFVARKSLAVNLSDVAAMGARPTHAVAAVAVRREDQPRLEAFFRALREAADEYGVEIVGGDLSSAALTIINITAVGRIETRPLLRSGAKPGDRIYVSRTLGASAAGLSLLQRGWTVGERGDVKSPSASLSFELRELGASAIRRHIDPAAESDLGPLLASIAEVTSCIDISDGLSTDLNRLCAASGCGALIERERLPIFPDLLGAAPQLGLRASELVLHGGEEYALLFTSSLRESEMSERVGRPVYAIGRIRREPGMTLMVDGIESELEPRGFDHFAVS